VILKTHDIKTTKWQPNNNGEKKTKSIEKTDS